MRIRQSILINHPPDIVIAAAEDWLRTDVGPAGHHIVPGSLPNGARTLSYAVNSDDIIISTSLIAKPIDGGTELTMTMRMQGATLSGKLRNLTMLPMTAMVRREVRATLDMISRNIAEHSPQPPNPQ